MSRDLLKAIQDGEALNKLEQTSLAMRLATPAMLALLSFTIMQYIDAGMVGSLGAKASAAIGLVSTTLWLFSGVSSSFCKGFYVQVAHLLGAKRSDKACSVLRQSIVSNLTVGLLLMTIGLVIAPHLPHWLGGDESICRDSTLYFTVMALIMPLIQMEFLATGMLQCSGNTKVPAIWNILACFFDVVFNYIFIFHLHMGVLGAAMGTALSEVITAGGQWWYLCFRSKELHFHVGGRWLPKLFTLQKAWSIAWPMTLEHIVMCSAQITLTVIVAPMGPAVIAANAFGITIEALCYMPGHGISDAATTLVGQSIGAGRQTLARSFAWVNIGLGMLIMTMTGAIMYIAAPWLMPLMTPDVEVQDLTVMALRIEAFAEPMYAASIVAYGVFVGAAYTKVPCAMNLVSMWVVRITLAMLLAPTMGLKGVWIAMAIELCFRGAIFLLAVYRYRFENKENIQK